MAVTAAARTKTSELLSGWRLLAASTIGIASGMIAIPFYTNALFFPSLKEDFGWSSASLSFVVLVYNLAWGVLLPYAGRIVDRFGARRPALFSGVCLAGGYLVLSLLGNNYAVYLLVVVVTMVLALATGPISYSRAINQAFDQMRGLALGITLAGSGLTAVIAPQLLGPVIENSGWRAGFRALALVVLVATLTVFALIPSDAGSRARAASSADAGSQAGWLPTRTILADSVFRRLSLAFVCMALATGGMVIYLYAMMRQAGVSESRALWVQSSLGFSVVAGRLISGYLYDRLFAPYVAAATMALGAAGLGALALAGPQFAIVGALTLGLCIGAEVDVIALLVSRYFALDRFAQVYGFAYGANILGLAASPYILGLIVDHTTGFVPAVTTSVAFLIITVVVLATLPRYGTLRHSEQASLTDGSIR
ncbi:MFS transporter [Streptomyces sp. NPDC002519]